MFNLQLKKAYSLCLLITVVLLGASVAAAQKTKSKKTRTTATPSETKSKTAEPTVPVAPVVKTEIVKPVKVNIQRIGIVSPKATLADVSATEASNAVQNSFYEVMKSKVIDVIAIEARLPIQVMPEAEEKEAHYILYTTLSQKKGKSDNGFFGKMTGNIANRVASRIPYGKGIGGQIAIETASEALRTVSTLATTIKTNDEMTLEYKLVRVEDSQAVVSNSITAKAKENGEDIITKMIETAANEVLTKVVSSTPRTSNVESSPSNAQVANTSEIPKATQNQTTILFVPFAKVMNEAFAKDYVGKSIKTKVRFVAPGQTNGWVFDSIPPKAMQGKLAFRVSESEEIGNSETPFGTVLPHIFTDKDKADLIFGLKKGDFLILTGTPVVGTTPLPNGGTYTQIIFVATSIERAK